MLVNLNLDSEKAESLMLEAKELIERLGAVTLQLRTALTITCTEEKDTASGN